MGIINGYQLGGVDMPTIAQEHSTTTQYEVGDYIVRGDSLYRCISATVGNFDITKWQLTNMGADVKSITEKLGGLNFVVLTQAEYDELETKDANTLYFIKSE